VASDDLLDDGGTEIVGADLRSKAAPTRGVPAEVGSLAGLSVSPVLIRGWRTQTL
jgi:hypothetical protein